MGFDIFTCPIPFSLKILYTAYVCVLVPAYWSRYGPANFLWFSDLALLIGLAALWHENPLLASMQTVSVLLLELLWSADFFIRAVTGKKIVGLAEYMFKSDTPLWLRGLSLFHLALPVILLWQVYCFGYDQRAWLAQTTLFWAVVLVCFFFTKPADNINWVFGAGDPPQRKLPASLYIMLLLVAVPLLIYLPTHLLLSALMPQAGLSVTSSGPPDLPKGKNDKQQAPRLSLCNRNNGNPAVPNYNCSLSGIVNSSRNFSRHGRAFQSS